MLSRLRIKLQNEKIGFIKGSAFQGVLFENIASDYVEKLHQQQMHPYSQHIRNESGSVEWVVNALTDEAYEQIIMPLLKPGFDEINLKSGDINSKILSKELETVQMDSLMEEFKNEKSGRHKHVDARWRSEFGKPNSERRRKRVSLIACPRR